MPGNRITEFLAPYRRITSSGAFIPEIDGFRFIAILSVFLYHLSENVDLNSSPQQVAAYSSHWAAHIVAVLNIGVPLFFVVSGFVLGMPFAEMHVNRGRAVSLKKYFLRRLTRLEPPYILALSLLLLLKLVTGRGGLARYLPHFLASIFYLHNAIYAQFSTIDVVAWSLEVEVQFYILAPLLAMIFVINRTYLRRLTIAALILGSSFLAQVVAHNARLSLSLLEFGQYFLAGFLLADIHLTSGGKYRSGWGWDLVSFSGWTVLLTLLTRTSPTVILWVAPWLIFVIYYSAFRSMAVRQFFRYAVITTIGGMCYTIYLLHLYMIYSIGLFSQRLLRSSPFEVRILVQFAIMAPVVLLLCAVYFRFVERPCMRPDWPARLRAKFHALASGRAQSAASA